MPPLFFFQTIILFMYILPQMIVIRDLYVWVQSICEERVESQKKIQDEKCLPIVVLELTNLRFVVRAVQSRNLSGYIKGKGKQLISLK